MIINFSTGSFPALKFIGIKTGDTGFSIFLILGFDVA
jgi:hypothetical protein